MTTHDELRKLAEAATPGDWSANVLLAGGHPAFDEDMVGVGIGGKFVAVCGAATSEQSQIDARYVAATNPETILALLDELEQVQADNRRLIEDRARFPDRPDFVGRMISAHFGNLREKARVAEQYAANYRAKMEQYKKDAERYQWLRKQPNDTEAPRIDVVYWTPNDESSNQGEGLRLDELDAAIDAAIATAEGNV